MSIKPTADGKALVVVAGDTRVSPRKLIDAPASGASVDIPVSADWGAGAYVLVTDYRPLNQATGREPVRSIGVAWLGVDNSERTLTPLIGGPKKILPRQQRQHSRQVKGLAEGEDAYLTLAAVDEGILQLTDFKSPDPVGYYFGKRRLGVGMHDDYGRLIKAEKGAVGAMREGGDNFGGRPLAVVPTKTVALFSGLVKVGAGGMAQVPLDVPDFNGELRLMAVVVSDKQAGPCRPAADRARSGGGGASSCRASWRPATRRSAALNINNVEGRTGRYTATITTSGPVGFDGGAHADRRDAARWRAASACWCRSMLDGRGLGIANIALKLAGPAASRSSVRWQIEVRAPQLDIARDDIQPLAAASELHRQPCAGRRSSFRAHIDRGAHRLGEPRLQRRAGPAALARQISLWLHRADDEPRHAASCTSTISPEWRASPKDQALHDRVQEAVDNVLDMQNFAGNFGMWGPGSDADPWLSRLRARFPDAGEGEGLSSCPTMR